jgi:hypothetical protein
MLRVAGKEARNHTGDNEYRDENPNPFDNFFGIFVVEKAHI